MNTVEFAVTVVVTGIITALICRVLEKSDLHGLAVICWASYFLLTVYIFMLWLVLSISEGAYS